MGWWKTAKPGDFVVSVTTSINPPDGADSIFRGHVYEIREVFVAGHEFRETGEIGVRLCGMNNGHGQGHEAGWHVSCFRPVQSLPSSITSSLTAPNPSVREDA
jgi:hypothetical protein